MVDRITLISLSGYVGILYLSAVAKYVTISCACSIALSTVFSQSIN
jgi:hypothetical protein